MGVEYTKQGRKNARVRAGQTKQGREKEEGAWAPVGS